MRQWLFNIALALVASGLLAVAVLSPFSEPIPEQPSEETKEELQPTSSDLWLARVVWSETKRLYEQRLVAWAVRNRVESERYPDTYRSVALQEKQFSAFNDAAMQEKLEALTGADSSFRPALTVAMQVRRDSTNRRPFGPEVTHFFSPRSMEPPGSSPRWADGAERVLAVPPGRFWFYEDVR